LSFAPALHFHHARAVLASHAVSFRVGAYPAF
jgi:hypothetical protein